MFPLSKEYQESVKKYWEKYIERGEPIPEEFAGIRPEVLESWKRSLKNRISPIDTKPPIATKNFINKLLKKNEKLISIAHPYIQNLYVYVKSTNFAIVLTDKEGYVIDLLRDDTLIAKRMNTTGLDIGSPRSEKFIGTSGIGTCIYYRKPFQIWGYEHFIKPHHVYICSAAPIFDEKEELTGCIAMIGPRESTTTHSLGMVSAAADGICKEMRMRNSYEQVSNINSQLKTILECLTTGIIMVNQQGIVIHYNQLAAEVLKLENIEMVGKPIAKLVSSKSSIFNISYLHEDILNQEVHITNFNQKPVDVTISASLIMNKNKKIGAVYTIDRPRNIHKLVAKFGGFNAAYTFDSIIGHSPAINHVKNLGANAAEGSSNVLILGESGTGKELFAQAVHNASSRFGGPFIAINCASLPKSLIESELFGYEQGAFTGANKDGNPGKFELADGGTIFLDEIGDMPLELQASLLRVLETREITRIGGKQPKKIDIRIIAATNADLLQLVRENRFRNDLYYRINVLSIHIPPLRKRTEDIPLLTDFFLKTYSSSMEKQYTIVPRAREILSAYSWPGNVRELENVIERAINISTDGIITEKQLPSEILNTDFLEKQTDLHERPAAEEYNGILLPSQEYQLIIDTLRKEHGSVQSVSIILGIPKRTLYRKIKKYGIDLKSFQTW